MDLIVVGAGWAGERHVQAIKALQGEGADVRLGALVDTDADHLAAQAAQWGVTTTYPVLAAALDALPQAEAVVLATPHHLHREGTEQAASAGLHVLVEKPMALTLEDADAMFEACQDARTTLMVAESARYTRRARTVRDVLDRGTIGQVLTGRLNLIPRGHKTFAYPGRRAWLADPAVCGGGIWMLNGIHAMSVARMLLGEVTAIVAREVRSDEFRSELESTVVALVSFDSGAVLTMIVSAELHGYRRYGDLVLFGSEGTLDVNRRHGDGVTVYTDGEPEVLPCASDERGGAPGSFVRELEEFLSAIAQGREPYTSGSSERETLAAILAGYESMRTGQPVAPQRAP